MTIRTEACRLDELEFLFQRYAESLSSPFDAFLEEHILASDFHAVLDGDSPVGYYAVHGGELLTQFHLLPSGLHQAQTLFARVLREHDIKRLFVPTCDELFLSLALDREGAAITRQAYFFQHGADLGEVEAARAGGALRPALIADRPQIEAVCGDFLDRYDERIGAGELFAWEREGELLGIGVVERSRLLPAYASIGMFTHQAHRRQGIGRAILVGLKKLCRSEGRAPIAGCWYYNEASKRTLESAGMVTRTRLLNIDMRTEVV